MDSQGCKECQDLESEVLKLERLSRIYKQHLGESHEDVKRVDGDITLAVSRLNEHRRNVHLAPGR